MPEKEKKSKKSKAGSDEPPLTAVQRLQSLNLVSRVASEWNNHLGISDRTLAEFVINLAERRIKSFLKEQFVREDGSCYNLSLSDDGADSNVRVGLISSAIERDVETISTFRSDLISNGAGEAIPPTFAARILRVVCDMSPRMERQMKKMDEKKRTKKQKLQKKQGVSVHEGGDGTVMSSIAPSERKNQMEGQFPGLGGTNLTGSVPLEEGFYEHNRGDPDKNQDFNVHDRSRNKRGRWDNEGNDNKDGENKEPIDSGKRSKSNLPAWMTQKTDAAAATAKETSVRSKSNLPAWMIQKQQGGDEKQSELKLYQIFTGTTQRVLDFGVVVEINAPGSSSTEKITGMVHLAHVSKNRVEKPRDAGVRPGQRVYVKLISIGKKGVAGGAGEGGLMLSMKDVDQNSGKDLMPHRTAAASGGMGGSGNGNNGSNNATENAAASASAAVVHPGLDVAALKRRQEEEEAENITHRQMQGLQG
eukprot:CAMPEP_0201941824 /NCGR_PEP_ID=MMETSP0903-20130614/47783_1 /ASSEMBLY_ACC=CAM_ASM_000552 /TAXON_ID=420261 /ORGANISM="Thalassiosira antarctica, Strain CCMP982" /LENGTH=474 /DNA_ID=CAMNT_0048483999 /DNA_START=23 /DNA_END=1443 /DNA_ORIENTATION=+